MTELTKDGTLKRLDPFYRLGQSPANVRGPACCEFPDGLAEAPVSWEYFGDLIPMKFKAGFVGATQEEETYVVKPLVGWFIERENLKKQRF